ncbi:hypothetical protein QML68_15975 [Providencia huaxiensis]|nr:hypothetical protein [Providencia huaxiensis]MDI7241114.1 hypothetical protein [Providencia huaxiensis]
MHPFRHSRHLFRTFLSGTDTPFPNIYDAVSEQILLLILKARQLNENTEFSKWFAEQHQVLTKLRAQCDKINEIYNNQNYLSHYEKPEQDSLMYALIFMRPLYTGFDENKVNWLSWGEMLQQSPQQRGLFAKQNELFEKFIREDVYAILADSPTHCLPIPAQKRKGYCHQDLSIAHSYSNELLSLLDDFHKIDSQQILANVIYNLINELHRANIDTPDYLLEFEKVCGNIGILFGMENHVLNEIIRLINDEGRVVFIERLSEQCAPQYANYILDQFIGIYASKVIHWLDRLQMYFNYAQSTPFEWKFTTVTPDVNSSTEEEGQQSTVAWESDYCQISIKRDTLLKLIHTNALHDAADSLADCLLHIYNQPAAEMLREKVLIPQITDQERHVYSSNSYHFTNVNQGNYLKWIDILKFFEKWYENNKVLLISLQKKRTERINVVTRLAGLKFYDLKMGIPDDNRMKIKDGIHDRVRQDTNLRFEKTISDVSLQRYYTQVKKIIKNDIDDLLLNQRNNNSIFPFSGSYHAIKPLWSKSDYHEEEWTLW